MKPGWKAALAAAAIVASTAAATAQETRLLFTSQSPAGSRNVAWFTAWAQRVNAQSAGTLKIEVKEIGPLANFGNAYNRVLDDVVQIGWGLHSSVAGKFRLTEAISLPLIGDRSAVASVAAGRTGDAYVLWSTILSPANNSGTLFLTRVVNGVPLFPPTQVTDWPANSTHIYANPSVAVDGRGFVYAAWGDSRTDYWGDIYFARSIDGGRTFEPNERIVDLALGDGTVQVYPDIAANANGSVVVVWTDTRQDPDGGDIYSAVPTYLSSNRHAERNLHVGCSQRELLLSDLKENPG